MGTKLQKEKKFTRRYYIIFASFLVIFVISLIFLPKLMNEQSASNEEPPPIVDPVTEPTKDQDYYEELKQFFPPHGTVATFNGGDYYSESLDVETYWLGDRYVQEVIYAKARDCNSCTMASPTKTYVYRITNEEIELVYDGYQLEWAMEELEELSTMSVILKGPIEVGTEIGAQKIIATDAELVTAYDTFTNVVVVEGGVDPTTPEIHSISYYVPNYGLVKREIEGFWNVELASITFEGEVAKDDKDLTNLLKSYFFPSDDADAYYMGGFENGGEKVQTKWISDEFVQQITSNGGATIERIYKIRGNQIELIYQEMIDGASPSSMTIEELEQLPTINKVMKAPFKVGDQFGEWKVVDTNGKLSTFYSSFTKVLILENQLEDSITRKYYAKGYGEVKLEFEFYNEETGQFEESDFNTELTSFGPIMNEVEGNYIFRVFEEDKTDINSVEGEKISPLETKRAVLYGRGVDFEGINQLVIEDFDSGKFIIYKYRHEGEQYTPKDIEWIDENRLYVIVGYGFGTVTMGGQLYELNITNNSIKPVFENLTEKEEIMSVESNGDGTFTYKKHVYEDDNYSVGHVEEGIITPTNE